MRPPHVQVLLDGDRIPPALSDALSRLDAGASFASMRPAADRTERFNTADLFVIVRPEAADDRAAELDRICDNLRRTARTFLTLNSDGSVPPAADAAPARPRPDSTGEVLVERLRELLRGYAARQLLTPASPAGAPVRPTPMQRFDRRLHAADEQMTALRGTAVPTCPGFRFHELFEPARFDVGDCLILRQIDADHIAAVAAGALGGTCPTAFATWVQSWAPGTHAGRSHPMRPDVALASLNRELCAAGSPPVAATVAMLNMRTRRVDIARAGAPFPIIRRAGRTLALARPTGILAGADRSATYAVETVRLGPGDAIVVLSRGVESLIDTAGVQPRRTAPMTTPHREDLGAYGEGGLASTSRRSWYRLLRDSGPSPAFERLRERRELLRRIGYPLRDVSAVGIEAV